jgi:uncharacterized protein YodC (DUF2158 family)
MNAHTTGFNDANGFPEADEGFHLGDIVQLLTGSPLMTVLDACDECGEVDVAFYDSELHILTLPEEAIVHWDGDDE